MPIRLEYEKNTVTPEKTVRTKHNQQPSDEKIVMERNSYIGRPWCAAHGAATTYKPDFTKKLNIIYTVREERIITLIRHGNYSKTLIL
jgi:hypothetical protein